MNTEEQEGTQSLGETQLVARASEKSAFSDLQQITFNIFHALDVTKELVEVAKDDQNGMFLITVQSINSWHKKLWKGVKNGAGVHPGIPRSEQFTLQEDSGTNSGHTYPKSDTVSEGFQIFVDRFNEIAESIRNTTESDSLCRLTESIKWSAWALFYCLSLHPYTDGNGRTSRLLCNYVLSAIFPFDVPVYNVYCKTTRKDYIKALETSRNCPCSYPMDDGQRRTCSTYSEILEHSDPSLIATLVLESCWATCYAFWKRAVNKIPDILVDFPLEWSVYSPGIILAARSLSATDRDQCDELIDATDEEIESMVGGAA